jgi:hypothetical protein
LHRPPHTLSVELVQAARPPIGWPEVTLVQVPAVLLQVWHAPGQSVWQHTPSGEHFPDEHSTPLWQVLPEPLAFFAAQVPELQYWPVGQESGLVVHEPEQVTPSHTPVAQGAAL